MNKRFTIILLISNLVLLGAVLSSNMLGDSSDVIKSNEVNEPVSVVAQKVLAIKLPDNMSFAGEKMPVEDFDVHERLDRELLVNTYWHSNSLQLFKLAERSFPTIEAILKAEGVPDDFKYLALAESGLRDVVSPANACGVWQFLKGTGKEYGLEVNSVVDERYHLEKATLAACKYLKDAKEELGSWTLAAAAYNAGKPRIKSLMGEQHVDNYYDLYLTTETARYVFRIVALKELFNNPERYGFYLEKDDLYSPIQTRSVTIDTTVNDLPKFAIDHNTNYKTLKLLNPWLRQPYLTNTSGKTYEIKVPM